MEGELWLSRVGDVLSGTTLFSEGPMEERYGMLSLEVLRDTHKALIY